MIRRVLSAAAFAFVGLTLAVACCTPRSLLAAPSPLMLDYTFPAGTTVWTQPLVITGQMGMTISGKRHAAGVSRMVYRGGPTAAAIQLIGCQRCTLKDLEIVVEVPGVDAHVLIANAVNPGTDGYSTNNLIQNVRCPHTGVQFYPRWSFNVDSYAAGGANANNEQHRFDRCTTFVYSEAAFRIKGGQCHQLVFDGCLAANYGPGKPVGLLATEGGYFRWTNGSFTNNGIDIQTGTAEQMVIVDNTSSELSQQFLVTAKTGGMASFTLTNIRFDGNPVAGRAVVDGWGPNRIAIRDSRFAGINGICPLFRFGGAGGSLDLTGMMAVQHGGTVPMAPIISCPVSWDIRQHGLFHQMIDATGRQTNKAIKVNQLGIAQ